MWRPDTALVIDLWTLDRLLQVEGPERDIADDLHKKGVSLVTETINKEI